MAGISLRAASIYCLAIWVAIWLLFLLMRFSPFDIRVIPGIGGIMLLALIIVLLAPIVAMVLAAAAVFRQLREPLNWLTLGCSVAAFFCQAAVFLISRWL
jgi:multisubunit Na+/H+ antiporter MnhG subunit